MGYSFYMILTAQKIRDEVANGKLHISPFNDKHLGPNSYDLTLGNKLKVYSLTGGFWDWVEHKEIVLDSKKDNLTEEFTIPETGHLLMPNILYLGITNEEAGSDHYVPMVEGRSSTGRLGISIHATAGVGDLGFKSRWTLEISVIHPVIVYPNQRIGQVIFYEPSGEVKDLYKGKYSDQKVPVASQMWKDFK